MGFGSTSYGWDVAVESMEYVVSFWHAFECVFERTNWTVAILGKFTLNFEWPFLCTEWEDCATV